MSEFEPNPITKLFPLAVGGFTWQLHGLVIGIIVLIAFIVVVVASNAQVMSKESDDWIKEIQSRKWVIFIIVMLGIGISGI